MESILGLHDVAALCVAFWLFDSKLNEEKGAVSVEGLMFAFGVW